MEKASNKRPTSSFRRGIRELGMIAGLAASSPALAEHPIADDAKTTARDTELLVEKNLNKVIYEETIPLPLRMGAPRVHFGQEIAQRFIDDTGYDAYFETIVQKMEAASATIVREHPTAYIVVDVTIYEPLVSVDVAVTEMIKSDLAFEFYERGTIHHTVMLRMHVERAEEFPPREEVPLVTRLVIHAVSEDQLSSQDLAWFHKQHGEKRALLYTEHDQDKISRRPRKRDQ